MPLHTVIELMAVITSAIFGALLARRNQFDFVGVFSLALIVALGGGSLRDVLLNRYPLFWVENSQYPVIVFVIAVVMSFPRKIHGHFLFLLHIPDALGLGLFSILGTAYALKSGVDWPIAPLFGVITGTFGGVIGDIACNRVPSLFRVAPLYATCSFCGCFLYVALAYLIPGRIIPTVIATVFIAVFRLAAIAWNLRLPQLSSADHDNDTSLFKK